MKNKLIKLKKFLSKHDTINSVLSYICFKLLNKTRSKGNNKIIVNKSYFYKCKFIIRGTNNIIEFDDLCLFRNTIINITGSNNYIKVGKEVVGKNVDICIQDNNNKIYVGNNTYFAGSIHIAVTEGTSVIIGEDCLFSNSIVMRTGDSHSIYDIYSNDRVNVAKDIVINKHVWITERVIVLKGTEIGKDSIIASNSVVTKKFLQSNVVLGGSPAKILKDRVNWKYER